MARKSTQAVAEAVATLVEAVAEVEAEVEVEVEAAPVEAVGEPVLTVPEVAVEAAPVEAEAEPVLTVAEVEVEAAPVVTVPKPAVGAIGKLVEELLADASYNYLQILERVVAAFPTAKTTQRSIASVAADMRRRGLEVPMRNGKRMA
jgi:hypothetical protein